MSLTGGAASSFIPTVITHFYVNLCSKTCPRRWRTISNICVMETLFCYSAEIWDECVPTLAQVIPSRRVWLWTPSTGHPSHFPPGCLSLSSCSSSEMPYASRWPT